MRVITILAGGFSASAFDLRKLPGIIIAVNDSAYYAPKWDLCVSMDRLWCLNRAEWIQKQNKPVWLRRSAAERYEWTLHAEQVTLFGNDHQSTTLSDEPGILNGTHSGFCALNLAYQMRPLELYLIGFDMARGPRGEAHWHPQYPWVKDHATGIGRFSDWAQQFDGAARQLRRIGCSTFMAGSSAIKAFTPIDRCGIERRAECAA